MNISFCSYIVRVLTYTCANKCNLHFLQLYLEFISGFSQETLCPHNKQLKMKKNKVQKCHKNTNFYVFVGE